jgi:hypothetical protein
LFKESPRITNLVGLCFLVRVWSVKEADHTVQLKAYPGPAAIGKAEKSQATKNP